MSNVWRSIHSSIERVLRRGHRTVRRRDLLAIDLERILDVLRRDISSSESLSASTEDEQFSIDRDSLCVANRRRRIDLIHLHSVRRHESNDSVRRRHWPRPEGGHQSSTRRRETSPSFVRYQSGNEFVSSRAGEEFSSDDWSWWWSEISGNHVDSEERRRRREIRLDSGISSVSKGRLDVREKHRTEESNDNEWEFRSRRDEIRLKRLSSFGYVAIRVDRRGTGNSQGFFDDEYSQQEIKDGLNILQWIQQQSWSNRKVSLSFFFLSFLDDLSIRLGRSLWQILVGLQWTSISQCFSRSSRSTKRIFSSSSSFFNRISVEWSQLIRRMIVTVMTFIISGDVSPRKKLFRGRVKCCCGWVFLRILAIKEEFNKMKIERRSGSIDSIISNLSTQFGSNIKPGLTQTRKKERWTFSSVVKRWILATWKYLWRLFSDSMSCSSDRGICWSLHGSCSENARSTSMSSSSHYRSLGSSISVRLSLSFSSRSSILS